MKRHRVILPAALLLPLFWVPDGLAQSSVIAPAEPKLELVVQTGHSQLVGSVCLSYDGRWMVTGSYDKSAILWDTHSGRMLRVFKTGASNTSISLSRDGTRLATAAADYKAALWDTHTGKQLQTFPGVKDYGFDSLSLSGDGKRLAGISKGDAYVWDTQTAKLVRKFDGPQDARHFRLALNHDGKRLVTGSGKTAILWNVDTGGKLQTFAGHTGFVGSVCLSDDGTRLATRAGDDVAILWDTESGKKLKTFQAHKDSRLLSLSGDAARLVTDDFFRTPTVWDTRTGQKLKTIRVKEPGPGQDVYAVSLGREGRRLAIGTSDSTAMLFDVETGQRIQFFDRHLHGYMSLSGDGKRLTTEAINLTWYHKIHVWDTQTGQKVRTFRGRPETPGKDHDDLIHAQLSEDGKSLLTGTRGVNLARVILWDIQTGRQLHTFPATRLLPNSCP